MALFPGHMATDFERGLAAPVAGKPGLPQGTPPRYRREGDFILARLAELIAEQGGDLRHIVRVDQFYPDYRVVNAYQRSRKALLHDFVPPSTSVLVNEVLVGGATMDVSMIAVLPAAGEEPRPARPDGVPVPAHSGFVASLVAGDYVFVAGQMPNNDEMTGLAKPAYRPPSAIWNGTDIRLQTEFVITSRLKPALEAGGSSLKNALKAQVYLTNIEDLPEFLDVWNNHFGEGECALTVVSTTGLALAEATVEINILGLRDDGRTRKEIVYHEPSRYMRLGAAAVRAGDLLCLSGLYAADENGALPLAAKSAGLKHFGVPLHHQMQAIITAAADICRASGTSLDKLLRVNHFVADLSALHPMIHLWRGSLSGAPIPFGAVRVPTPMAIPGCDVIADMWIYRP